MKLTDSQMLTALGELGIQVDEFHAIRTPGPLAEMQARLDEFQARVKKAYREAAMRLHPDRNPDDPESEDLFKRVSEVVRQLQALRVQERPRPRPQVIYYSTSSTGSTSWTSSTAGGTIRINVKVNK